MATMPWRARLRPLTAGRPRTDSGTPEAPPGEWKEQAELVTSVQAAPSEGNRRALNIAVAGILIVLALPIMVLVAILVKLTSRGPILYRQTRIGLDRRLPGEVPAQISKQRICDVGGKPFVIYKFRTMRVDAERGTGAVWATKEDPRITWIGGLLRQARLDELPQLFNVLKGDMNVVGPRPERPSIFARLTDEVERYPLRQQVRPGITGLAQVSQQYDRSMDDVVRKLEFDLDYVRNQGFWTDLLIMLKTIPVVLFRKGGW